MIVGDKRAVLSGVGDPGNTVVIVVDDLTAASVVVPESGVWEVTLPPLAAGSRQLRAYQVDSFGRQSEASAPIVLLVVEAAPLDFSGYGRTAVTTWRSTGGSVVFKVREVSGGSWRTTSVPGQFPAPGDYDGDGVTDPTAVGVERGALVWTIERSASGRTSRVILGARGNSILTGCKLSKSSQITLTAFAQQERRLVFRRLDGQVRESAPLTEIRAGDLMGCGDVDGDGVDEVLFKVPGDTPREAKIVAFDTRGQKKLSKSFAEFVRGYVVRRVGADAPLVAIIKSTLGRGIPIQLSTLAGTFSFPLFYVAEGSTIATGLFGEPGAEQVPGAIWSDPRTRQIFYRLFQKGTPVNSLFKLPHGYQLLRPVNVFRTNSP